MLLPLAHTREQWQYRLLSQRADILERALYGTQAGDWPDRYRSGHETSDEECTSTTEWHEQDHVLTRYQAKQKFVEEFRLRTAAKEKPIMRVEDEFECLKTLWGSKDMVFELEVHRIAVALLMKLAGGTGNRPKALLQLRFRDISVALLPDPQGSEWPRVVIDWKFENTKGYLGAKDTYVMTCLWSSSSSVLTIIYSNEIPIPDILNEPCLLLCPHTTFLSLAFLSSAFAVTDLTPATLYSLKVPPGSGQLLIPWKESMKDVYVFRKLLRTPLGVELSDEHLPYDFLRTQLRRVGELTNFAFPVGAYCFRRGHGEALNNTSMS